MNYQISVIVPLYNIKWNLFKFCLDSILSQLNNNIELLIINDGSKERESVDCCKKYIKKYENVRLIDRLENRGVSETRNEGIEYSCGRFLMFVDADDVLESGAIQKIETLIRADASIDTVFFEYSVLKDGIKRHCFRQIEAKDCRKFNKKMAERMVLGIDFNSPCTIVYSKRIIDENNIRFDSQLALGEDFKFNTQYLHEFSNGAYIKESLYIYRMREGSATNSFSIKKVKDTGTSYFIGKELIQKFFEDGDSKKIKESFYNLYYKSLLSHILNGILSGASKKQIEQCYLFDWVIDMTRTNGVNVKQPLKFIINRRSYMIFWTLSQIKLAKQVGKKVKKVNINE